MKCPTPLNIADPSATHKSVRITVPCGKCGACRANRRADWSFRLKQELKQSINCFFLTLTYEDDKLPHYLDRETGELIPELRKKDLQDFLKRIRARQSRIKSEMKIRYYAVGEYGTHTDRPHYHALIFNVELLILESLPEIWGQGFATATPVTDARIHYVTKFHVNAQKTPGGKTKEFATMSRNPGIGSNYLQKNKKWHIENKYFHVVNNGYKQRLPRYYKQKLFGKLEKDLYALKTRTQAEENLLKEIQRLRKIGIKEPERYIHESFLNQAKRVKDKGKEGGTF